MSFLELLWPTVAASLTVPLLQGLKRVVGVVDKAPAIVKQASAIGIAYGVTELGVLLDTQLPVDLAAWGVTEANALLAGVGSWAIHAGKKAKGPGVRGLVLALAFVGAPAAAACQTGQATVTVVDRSRLEVLIEPPTYTGEVGDTVTFIATAVDTISGDTIPAQIRWSSLDETGVSIDPFTGLATLLQAGTYTVEAEVLEIVSIVFLTQEDDGSWRETYSPQRHALYAARGFIPDTNRLEVGESRPICTYLETEDGFIEVDAELTSLDPSIVSVEGTSSSSCPTWDGATATMSPMELFQLAAKPRIG